MIYKHLNRKCQIYKYLVIVLLLIFVSSCSDRENEGEQTLEDQLWDAAKRGRSEEVQRLLESGANPYHVYDGNPHAFTLLGFIGYTEIVLKNKDDPSFFEEKKDLFLLFEKDGVTLHNLNKTRHVLDKWQEEHPGVYRNPYPKPLVLDVNSETEQRILRIDPKPASYPNQ
jgi:hypothetical protein